VHFRVKKTLVTHMFRITDVNLVVKYVLKHVIEARYI